MTTLKIRKTPHIIKIVQIQKLNKQHRRNTHHEMIKRISSPNSQYNYYKKAYASNYLNPLPHMISKGAAIFENLHNF
jgi:hypothetical protein